MLLVSPPPTCAQVGEGKWWKLVSDSFIKVYMFNLDFNMAKYDEVKPHEGFVI